MNVLFDYMYRDFGNWKMGGEVVFANPDGLSLVPTEQRLRRACCQESNFNARQVGVPEVYFEQTDVESDQVYHEFRALKPTDKPVTDSRTLRLFVEEFESAARRGWEWQPRMDAFGYPVPVGRRIIDVPPMPAASTKIQAARTPKSPAKTSTARTRRGASVSRKAASPHSKPRRKKTD